jgi:lipopolysaccharide transport system ATP-binding protein
MSDIVIQVDRLWKKYRLGVLGTGTLRHDFNRWLHRTLGKPDPYAKVGENQKPRSQKSEVRSQSRIASLLEVGTGFHPELTGRENIFLNGAILGMTKPEIRKKFDELVAFAEVEQFIDTPVKRYSAA